MIALTIILGFLFVGVNSQGAITMGWNSDGTSIYGLKQPLFGVGNNQLSAIAQITKPTGIVTKGLSLDNINGNGLSLSHTKIPAFGEQLTGAGRLNLIHNSNHNLDLNAFATKNMPTQLPGMPNFNTVGGNLDYMFKDKIGATLGASRTPFLHQTDYSAMGKLNLFRSPTTRFDLNAGLQRIITPQFSRTQPFGGITLTKFFNRR